MRVGDRGEAKPYLVTWGKFVNVARYLPVDGYCVDKERQMYH
jgi:hypothetical protein